MRVVPQPTLVLSLAELRAARLRAQGLVPRLPSPRSLLAAVRSIVGVNAQLVSAMALSLRARVAGLTWEALETSRVERRALVRTWCMRGTLHLLPAEDLDELLSAISPADVRFAWRWLEKRAGLTGERARLVADTTYQVLKRDGPLTRAALMAAAHLIEALKPGPPAGWWGILERPAGDLWPGHPADLAAWWQRLSLGGQAAAWPAW